MGTFRRWFGPGFLTLLAAVVFAPPASAAPYPVLSFDDMLANEARFVVTGQDPAQSPPGVNIPCTPSAAHPNPVVLVHGFPANQYQGNAHLGPVLANAGYCVYALNYGGTNAWDGGLAPAAVSAAQLAAFVGRVRAWTGAAEVDLVGHSSGAFVSIYLAKTMPGASAVIGRIVAMAPPVHGASGGPIGTANSLGVGALLPAVCAICADVSPGSPVLGMLNAGPVAQPGIEYTTIASTRDMTVTPVGNAAITEPGVTNIVVQSVCPSDPVGHSGLAFDPSVDSMILNALDPGNAQPVRCGAGPAM